MTPRQAAFEAGRRTYIGKPCRGAGHIVHYTNDGSCVICHQNQARARRIPCPPRAETPRQIARLFGEKTYIGQPCAHGHMKRYTINRSCVECDKISHADAKEAYNAYHRFWRRANPKKASELNTRNLARFRKRHPFYYQNRYDDAAAHRRAIQINTLRVIYGKLI